MSRHQLDSRLRTGEKYDRRIKITPSDKLEIIRLYEERKYNGERVYSHNSLARLYGVSKRLVYFTLHPDKREDNYKIRVARGGSKQYYIKEEHKLVIKEHRVYLRGLFDEGKIQELDKTK